MANVAAITPAGAASASPCDPMLALKTAAARRARSRRRPPWNASARHRRPFVRRHRAPVLAGAARLLRLHRRNRRPRRRTASAASAGAARTPQPPARPAHAAAARAAAAGEQPRQYTGDPISLDLDGVDLRAVLRTFAEVSGLNMVIDPDVQGTVDIMLTDVPWDQALDVILRGNQLDYTVDGTIVRIAKIETLEERTRRGSPRRRRPPSGRRRPAALRSRRSR